ncbi:MAG: metalloregulator ArsR/SmtB family transcription factor [Spirochaetales bacterium]|nr:metalloregulator ArsR/SmtB family transcription factor [Spirochaetales bacterium]
MSGISHFTTTLKLLSDPARLRVLAILEGNELTVKELTTVLHLGQSTLSSQLSQLKEQGLVTFRREGQYVFYRIPRHSPDSLEGKLLRTVREIVPEAEWYERDRRTLKKIMEERQEASLSYFREQKTQNQRSPGQGWESVAMAFLLTLRSVRVVDLGCGSGRLAALIARAGNTVIGVDNSPEQIRLANQMYHTEETARTGTLSFVSAPMEETGLEANLFDLAVISHALHHVPRPLDALSEAQRILKTGGQLLILDLASHQEDWIQEKFGDFWLGFSEDILTDWMHEAGFSNIRFEISGRDLEYPAIEALVLSGIKPS